MPKSPTSNKSKKPSKLTWIGKEERAQLELSLFLEGADLSYHAAKRVNDKGIFDKRLIHEDNPLALKALELRAIAVERVEAAAPSKVAPRDPLAVTQPMPTAAPVPNSKTSAAARRRLNLWPAAKRFLPEPIVVPGIDEPLCGTCGHKMVKLALFTSEVDVCSVCDA